MTYSAYSPLGGVTRYSVFDDPTAKAIAAAHNRSAAQVALRWVAQQGALFVTAGSNPQYLNEDLHIFDFELSEEEMALLASR